MQRRLLFLAGLLFAGSVMGTAPALYGQAAPTASRIGILQVGAGYMRGQPDYSPTNFNGFSVWGTFDVYRHFGAEATFHHLSNGKVGITENSYEAGGRYTYPIKIFSPYLKVQAGVGTFSFQNSLQNGTYGMYSGGGGIDVEVYRKITARADYEYQRWGNFPPRGLQPNLVTIGLGYRFR